MKRILFFVFTSFCATGAFSQTFMHGAGVGVFIDKATGIDANAYGTLIYSPRVNVVETEALAVSVGVPLSIGFSGSYNSRSDYGSEGSLSFMFNAPLIVNLNMGRGSTKENEQSFGYFVGGGFGYHYGAKTEGYDDVYGDYHSSTSLKTYGPAANAGMRFGVGQSHRNIEVLFSFMKGISDSKASVYGVSGLFNF